jgi:hypothetical protein
VVGLLSSGVVLAREPEAWFHAGPVRVRDLTPFGLVRLDFLPAHAVPAGPGSWALEVNLSYQNTYVLSDNIAEYLRGRGGSGRVRLTPDDIATVLSWDEDAYLADIELGLIDVTYHYRVSPRWGLYLTWPAVHLGGGFLDATIEGFHSSVGLSTANRDLAERDRFQGIFNIHGQRGAVLDAPFDFALMDPVVGLRYSMPGFFRHWNVVIEGAVKLPIQDEGLLRASGDNDYGVQVSLQRFFRRQAVYWSASAVYVGGISELPDVDEQVVPTAMLGYEFKLTRRTNGILQLYASRSTIQDTSVPELSANKYQATAGVQSRRGDWVWRFAVTENLQNFNNTPDVGVTLSLARVTLAP